MNAHSNTGSPVPTWLWGALGVGILMLVGAIWLAASDEGKSKAKVDVQPYQAAVGAGPDTTANPPSTVPPAGISPVPLVGVGAAQPRVMITPLDRGLLQATAVRKPTKSKAKVASRRVSPVADMFPVGPIIPRVARAAAPAPRGDPTAAAPVQEETFPGFTYAGESWRFTGSFARATELELASTGLEVGGRSVLTLANTAEPATILFVQTRTDPGKYAIYR